MHGSRNARAEGVPLSSVPFFFLRAQEWLTVVFLCLLPGEHESWRLK